MVRRAACGATEREQRGACGENFGTTSRRSVFPPTYRRTRSAPRRAARRTPYDPVLKRDQLSNTNARPYVLGDEHEAQLMIRHTLRAALPFLVAASACSSNAGSASARPQGAPTPAPAAPGATSSVVNQADIAFMSGMIPHHAQAVLIAGWAPTHGASPDVQRLCERIVVGQRDEIGLMQRWLKQRALEVPAGERHAHEDGHERHDARHAHARHAQRRRAQAARRRARRRLRPALSHRR